MLNLWNWAIVGVLTSQELASAKNQFVSFFFQGTGLSAHCCLSIPLKLHNLINIH